MKAYMKRVLEIPWDLIVSIIKAVVSFVMAIIDLFRKTPID